MSVCNNVNDNIRLDPLVCKGGAAQQCDITDYSKGSSIRVINYILI